MVNKTDDDSAIKNRFKRSASPDISFNAERRFKTAKTELQQNGRNKENTLKRVQSEMILMKQSSSVFINKENHADISWHRSHPLWSNLLTKTLDKTYKCRRNFLDSHPMLTTKMRSVLLDWLLEVCSVYHLHRETYHLSVAYIDQYLSNTNDLPKHKFQLLGVTSLFVAAKLEEIYPPHLSDFAYVTDDTCSEEDILDMELNLMNILNWHISPITSIRWLLMYLQVDSEVNPLSGKPARSNEILQSSKLSTLHRSKDFLQTFASVIRLLDLCSLDVQYNQFPKHILTTSAICLIKSNWPAQQMTGLTDADLSPCREWMRPFSEVLGELEINSLNRSSQTIPIDEIYSIQTHDISIDLLENVTQKRLECLPTMIGNRPFRDLLNHFSWLPEKPIYDEEHRQINEIVVIV